MYINSAKSKSYKKTKKLPNCLHGAETSIILIVFDVVLHNVHTCAVFVSYRH